MKADRLLTWRITLLARVLRGSGLKLLPVRNSLLAASPVQAHCDGSLTGDHGILLFIEAVRKEFVCARLEAIRVKSDVFAQPTVVEHEVRERDVVTDVHPVHLVPRSRRRMVPLCLGPRNQLIRQIRS